MPHRRATCPTSRSHCRTPRVRGACGRWEPTSALESSTLSLCIHSLLERRDLWRQEAEARKHSQPDPTMPPGHTRMPENQRLETLSNLLQSKYLSWMGNSLGTRHPCPTLTTWAHCRPEPAAA